jgi:hypothetical protein
LFLALAGCKTIPEPVPITHLYVVDVQHDVCSVRKITDIKTLSSVWVEDKPLYICDGNVSLSMVEYLKFRIWLKNQK